MNFVIMDHYRNQLYGSITQSKFGIDPMFPAGDITILLICLFGWKMPNNVPFFLGGGGWGFLNPLILWVVIQTPKGTSLGDDASSKP